MKELTIKALVENVPVVTAFVDEELEGVNCPMKVQYQIDVAVDEVFSNIAMYAYEPAQGDATIRVEIDRNARVVSITFFDSGIPFNPMDREEPDTSLSVEEREIGGLGIFIVRKSMDEIFYEYKNGQNILCIKKKL
ncbi:MAG: ATP-binding protein [Oscillospiraceae bacterium]|nr:ATP-binding protein [Oscillospiraceae bacterium]